MKVVQWAAWIVFAVCVGFGSWFLDRWFSGGPSWPFWLCLTIGVVAIMVAMSPVVTGAWEREEQSE